MARDRDDDDDVDVRRSRGGDVPNYLVQSILVTLCCCLPLGIVGIINASKVNGLLASGDYDGAVRASEEAKKWCTIGFFAGIVVNAIWIAIQVMAGAGGMGR